MIALIDGDLVSFISAASAESEEEWIAVSRTARFVESILYETGASSYELYLSGSQNFRYSVFAEYKANRIGAYRPQHEKACVDHLKQHWNAVTLWDQLEADDMLGIQQSKDTVICSIDKDMRMIPGKHYSWAIIRKGEVVRAAEHAEVSDEEALHHFFTQLLVGDPADGIKGAVGIGKKKAVGILQHCKTELDYIEACRPYFSCDEEMEMNAKVLWIWRDYPDDVIERWKEAGYQSTVSES